MKNHEFCCAIDKLVAESEIIIDRPKFGGYVYEEKKSKCNPIGSGYDRLWAGSTCECRENGRGQPVRSNV